MSKKDDCKFCKRNFPSKDQLVSDAPDYWLFIHNINPQTDYHCLIVFKAKARNRNNNEIGHISNLNDRKLTNKAMRELGILLKKACRTIKACDDKIEKILVTSLNIGKDTKHLHFHLIPKKRNEKVKTVNNPKDDGGGMFFLGRKEIVVDTLSNFIELTTGKGSKKIKEIIINSREARVRENTKKLRKKFEWKPEIK